MLFQEVVVRMKLYMIENFDTYIEGGSFLRVCLRVLCCIEILEYCKIFLRIYNNM